MQTLKPEIREAILRSATKAFLADGFRGASVRAIAADAGVSASNLYSYFPNKEELFDAVAGPSRNRIIASGGAIARGSSGDWSSRAFVEGFKEEVAKTLGNMLTSYPEEFALLVAGSEGTKYARHRKEMEASIARMIAENVAHGPGQRTLDPLIARILATNFVEGLVRIVRETHSKEKIAQRVRALTSYHVAGIRGLMD